MNLENNLRFIKDFPKPGINFVDVTTILNNSEAFRYAVDLMAEKLKESDVNVIVATEARGFIFGSAIAYKLGLRFVPVRKPGKLPYAKISDSYQLEYGTDTLEMHIDAVGNDDKVAVIDDLLATGGTVNSVVNLCKNLGAEVVSSVFLVELISLNGKERLENNGVKVHSIVKIID